MKQELWGVFLSCFGGVGSSMLGRGSVGTGCRQGRGVLLEEPRSSASAGLELSCIQLLAAGVKVCALTNALFLVCHA